MQSCVGAAGPSAVRGSYGNTLPHPVKLAALAAAFPTSSFKKWYQSKHKTISFR